MSRTNHNSKGPGWEMGGKRYSKLWSSRNGKVPKTITVRFERRVAKQQIDKEKE